MSSCTNDDAKRPHTERRYRGECKGDDINMQSMPQTILMLKNNEMLAYMTFA